MNTHPLKSLYWKIFLSFWSATLLIIISMAWVSVKLQGMGHAVVFLLTLLISGFICYFLTLYLTQPLHSLRQALRSLARGKLSTRVGHLTGHHLDEIDALSHEFDKMAEKIETMVKSNQRLLQDISHELRSPLARIHVAIELGRKKSGNVAEFDKIESECARLNSLIGETLDFARLDKTSGLIHKEWVDLRALMQNIIRDANYEASGEKVQLLNKSNSFELFIDKKLIHRAIENVLRNALRYTPPGKIVTIVMEEDKVRQQVIVRIEDRGPGVPEQELTHIFKPFYRVDASREKTTGGFGLGLAIAKEAVAAHDGEIFAKNRPEGGLVVRIKLPKNTTSS